VVNGDAFHFQYVHTVSNQNFILSDVIDERVLIMFTKQQARNLALDRTDSSDIMVINQIPFFIYSQANPVKLKFA